MEDKVRKGDLVSFAASVMLVVPTKCSEEPRDNFFGQREMRSTKVGLIVVRYKYEQ